ncbi:MAG: hypothetical protein J3T61_12740 [Candidatus Brocadiales bacterium]|nr:hypothetical protein [Candidatus Bathyanammoxibius sp.]
MIEKMARRNTLHGFIKREAGVCSRMKPKPPLTMIEKMALAVSDTPFPSERSLKKARAALEAIQPEIMKVFEPYLSSEYSIPESITAKQIHDDMKALIHAALKETKP